MNSGAPEGFAVPAPLVAPLWFVIVVIVLSANPFLVAICVTDHTNKMVFEIT
jgi:hypothetical protein